MEVINNIYMKPYERRAKNAYPYFRLARYNERFCAFQEEKKAFPLALSASAHAARKPGKYIITQVNKNGTTQAKIK